MKRVVHFEIATDNPERTEKFYTDIFGWKFTKWEGPGNYWMINTGPSNVPGIDGGMGLKSDNTNACNTIQVDDVDHYLMMIRESGGQALTEKMTIPEVGYLAYFKDPDGNVFGIMTDDPTAGK